MEPRRFTIQPKLKADEVLELSVGNSNDTGISIGKFPMSRSTVLDVRQLENLHYWIGERINEIKGIKHDDSHETDYGPYCLTCELLGAV